MEEGWNVFAGTLKNHGVSTKTFPNRFSAFNELEKKLW